jgi:NAD(P)H dehydrogenase (quinone)
MKGPTFYPLFWLNNSHKVLMRRALFSYVGIKKVKFFEFGGMENPDGRQEQKLNRVYQYFRNAKYGRMVIR